MTKKTIHGFTLWAVPRFHWSDAIYPEAKRQERTGGPLHQFAMRRLEELTCEASSPCPARPRETAL